MKNNFNKAVEFVLKWEGGYSNNPHDPGGETKFGISKRAYPHLEISKITKEQAIAIYQKDYWQRCGCDKLEFPLDIIVFDTAVHCGQQRALVWLQEYTSWSQYLLRRIKHYAERGARHPQFLRGWLNRVIDLWELIIKGGDKNA